MYGEPNPLVGKTLLAVFLSEDKCAIMFRTPDGDMVVQCEGDCCSRTWIEHVSVPALGFPAVVIAVEDVDMPDLGDMPDCDVVAYYGCKITTNHGELLIDYRNDSNGYYGGSLSWPGERHYGGVFCQNNSSMTGWKDVTDVAG